MLAVIAARDVLIIPYSPTVRTRIYAQEETLISLPRHQFCGKCGHVAVAWYTTHSCSFVLNSEGQNSECIVLKHSVLATLYYYHHWIDPHSSFLCPDSNSGRSGKYIVAVAFFLLLCCLYGVLLCLLSSAILCCFWREWVHPARTVTEQESCIAPAIQRAPS